MSLWSTINRFGKNFFIFPDINRQIFEISSLKSTKIAQAVYNQNWSEADVRYQKMLVLIAERAQKPAILKATSFVLVSRGTMTEVGRKFMTFSYSKNNKNFIILQIMQLSYKFFALLRTMYVK